MVSISILCLQKLVLFARHIPQLQINMIIIAIINADAIAARTFCVIKKGVINKKLTPRYVMPVAIPARIGCLLPFVLCAR